MTITARELIEKLKNNLTEEELDMPLYTYSVFGPWFPIKSISANVDYMWFDSGEMRFFGDYEYPEPDAKEQPKITKVVKFW